MKRVGFIQEKIYDKENVRTAILNAAKGKNERSEIKRILDNIDYYINDIHNMIKNNNYNPSDYKIFNVKEGISKKERVIYSPKFYPDQIIHWCLMLQLTDIIKRGMYIFSCGSSPKRGIHYGKKYLEKWLRNDHKYTKYCLKMDISKFFPSIDKEVMKELFTYKIKDSDTLELINKIIDSVDKGLPIGNYTSQWFVNFYLEKLDHYIKEELKVKYYIRYIDDMVILSNNKKKLHKVRKSIDDFLFKFRLNIKKDWQVFLVDIRRIDFLGFRFFRDYTILRKSIYKRICSKYKITYNKKDINNIRGCISYFGWIKHSDCYILYNNILKPNISIYECKQILRTYN